MKKAMAKDSHTDTNREIALQKARMMIDCIRARDIMGSSVSGFGWGKPLRSRPEKYLQYHGQIW